MGVQIGYHKHFRIALWAARTSFWCPAVLTVRLNATLWIEVRYAAVSAGTGGLADTVSDCSLENLADGSPVGLSLKIVMPGRCYGLFGCFCTVVPSFTVAVCATSGYAMDFSWQVAAKSYRELYYRLNSFQETPI